MSQLHRSSKELKPCGWAHDDKAYLLTPVSVGYLQLSNCRKVLTAAEAENFV